ncbi:PAS domain-containing protein [Bradyrhizobium jicamae]|uniref:PAS domain-containing protein n=1 Tax=Bradyrhizobium jicamae TaxID=280332 RepID=UPI002012CC45|nr:PAS domain-containing protein [Bradyrhizobium jicamae]
MNIQERTLRADDIQSLASLVWQLPSAFFIEKLPLAVYACDAQGRILWFNSRAADLWGRSPRIGDDSELFCGSYKFYFADRPVSRQRTPMAEVLRTGIPIRGAEGRVERPDGSFIWAVVHIAPIINEDGNTAGAIGCFHERVDGGRLEVPDARPQDWMLARDDRLAATSGPASSRSTRTVGYCVSTGSFVS